MISESGATVAINAPIMFDTLILNNSPNIVYNSTNGEFTISEAGLYYVSWSVSTDGAAFSAYASVGVEVVGDVTINNSGIVPVNNLTGTALINIASTPQVVRLINTTPDSLFIGATPVQANIVFLHLS